MRDRQEMRAGRTPSAWVGWVVFAGTMAVIVGIFNVIPGLVVHGREMADR